jgi:hypothetical protein
MYMACPTPQWKMIDPSSPGWGILMVTLPGGLSRVLTVHTPKSLFSPDYVQYLYVQHVRSMYIHTYSVAREYIHPIQASVGTGLMTGVHGLGTYRPNKFPLMNCWKEKSSEEAPPPPQNVAGGLNRGPGFLPHESWCPVSTIISKVCIYPASLAVHRRRSPCSSCS